MSAHVNDLRRHVRELFAPARVNALAERVTKLWATRLDGNTDAIVLGRYELDHVLGRGSHGVVIAAHDRVLERDVALKVFHSATERDIAREAQALARVSHPNVVAIHDIGRDRGFVYLVMERVDGWTMHQRVRLGLNTGDVLNLFAQAGRGLAAVHRAGIVHGDIKPANILVAGDGRACIADFGMARGLGWRERGERLPGGTVSYMAPEHRAGAGVDAKSDQFSFAVALRDSLRSDALAALEDVLGRGLSPAPEDRHASMDELVDELEQLRNCAQPWRRAS